MSRDWRGAVVTKIEHRYTEDLWLGLNSSRRASSNSESFSVIYSDRSEG